MKRRFLTAEWRNLAMVNFEVDPALLKPLVPRGTELDSWNGKTFLSIVGFLFLRTRVLGIPVPCHRDFEEVNLRFYVRYQAEDGWRRGVVFVKEIVPKTAIAAVARWLYNENYVACPMRSEIRLPDVSNGLRGLVEYEWTYDACRNTLHVDFEGIPVLSVPGSEEEFITEHYWGYVRQRSGATVEYRVEHPPWRIWRGTSAHLNCNVELCYGKQFRDALSGQPTSIFVAEGSPVSVYRGRKI